MKTTTALSLLYILGMILLVKSYEPKKYPLPEPRLTREIATYSKRVGGPY